MDGRLEGSWCLFGKQAEWGGQGRILSLSVRTCGARQQDHTQGPRLVMHFSPRGYVARCPFALFAEFWVTCLNTNA